MPIDVRLDRMAIPIDDAVFTALLGNSVAGAYRDYERAVESGSILFSDLIKLARTGDIPYSLFFAPLPLVEAQVAAKTKALLAGVSKETFSIGSRDTVRLCDIELIVKDLIRKQELLKKHDDSLARNKIVGLLRKPGASVEADAAKLSSALGLSHEQLRGLGTKEKALDLMIHRLEASQVLVSRSVRGYMPQSLGKVHFSGMTIRDAKVPYIFLTGGNHGDYQEPVGRTIFTLALMSVLVARRIFAPVTWNGQSTATDRVREYDIAGAMLMPAVRIRAINPKTLEDMKAAANEFKVTPSAVTIRALRLGIIDGETARFHLDELRIEFEKIPKATGPRPIRPENAVRKYNGRQLTARMLSVLDSRGMTEREFFRTVCLNKLKPSQLGDLRRALA